MRCAHALRACIVLMLMRDVHKVVRTFDLGWG